MKIHDIKTNKMINNKKAGILFAALCLLFICNIKTHAVTVTLLTDEFTERPLTIGTAERNLGIVLTEINRAQKAKTILTTNFPWTISRSNHFLEYGLSHLFIVMMKK